MARCRSSSRIAKGAGRSGQGLGADLITVSGIQRVLQILLAERVSIRDLATILEGIADGIAGSRNPATLTEHVRARLSRQLCAQYTGQGGYLPLIAMSAKWEQAFAESLIGQGDERQLAMQPSRLSEFISLVRERFEEAAREGEAPVLVTSSNVRSFVRGIVERFGRRRLSCRKAKFTARAPQDCRQYLAILPGA
jgi:flagellar biosynthesis protein FlhA